MIEVLTQSANIKIIIIKSCMCSILDLNLKFSIYVCKFYVKLSCRQSLNELHLKTRQNSSTKLKQISKFLNERLTNIDIIDQQYSYHCNMKWIHTLM
jgi:hypothetical protein